MRTRRRHDEEGSALVLALAILVCVGVIAVASLSYAGASLKASNTVYKPGRTAVYDADSAIQTAIQYVKADAASGGTIGQDLGLPCTDAAHNLVYPGTSGNVTVNVCPQDDSLIHVGEFRASLLTLAPSSSGKGIQLSKNNDFLIQGHVWSNSFVDVKSPASMIVSGNGRLWAWNGCSGTIIVTAGKDCTASSTFASPLPFPKVGMDPGDPALGHEADWLPADPPGAGQNPSVGTCTIPAGVYSDPEHLTDVSDACTTLNLAAGTFYLNFPDENVQWSVAHAVQGATCAAGGTQIVFANESRINNNGDIVLPCGRKPSGASANAPRIGMIGLDTAVGGGGSQSSTLRPTAPATGSGSNITFTGLGNVVPTAAPGYPQDGTNAQGQSNGANRTATFTVGSISPTSGTIPSNAVVDSLRVKVGHTESNGSSTFQSATQLSWGGCTIPLSPQVSTAATTWTSADLVSGAFPCATFNPAAAASLTWSVQLPSNNDTARLDGVELVVGWHDPGILAQTGCVFRPTTTNGGCSIFLTPSNGHDSLDVEGVIYLPDNAVEGTFKNGGSFTVRDALIAWSLDLDVNPAAVGQPIIGSGTDDLIAGDVKFTAMVGATVWTEARVNLDDNHSFVPTINRWVIKH